MDKKSVNYLLRYVFAPRSMLYPVGIVLKAVGLSGLQEQLKVHNRYYVLQHYGSDIYLAKKNMSHSRYPPQVRGSQKGLDR